MIVETRTAREIFEELQTQVRRRPFGFGQRLALVNVDIQQAYTRPDLFPNTAYVSDPDQLRHVNSLARAARDRGLPVIWTRSGYQNGGADCGVWGTRTDTPDSLQNIAIGSPRHTFDPRLDIDTACDLQITKRMPSAFFETQLASYLVWHRIDTVVVTGGSTSGCVRATVVDALSHGYRTIVPVECVADKNDSYHFAALTDCQLKYADVLPTAAVLHWLDTQAL